MLYEHIKRNAYFLTLVKHEEPQNVASERQWIHNGVQCESKQ